MAAESRITPAQRRGDAAAGLVVSHHPLAQSILEVAKTIVVVAQKLAGRNRGRIRHYLGHAGFVYHVLAKTGSAGRRDLRDDQGAAGLSPFTGIAGCQTHQGGARLARKAHARGFCHGFQASFHDLQQERGRKRRQDHRFQAGRKIGCPNLDAPHVRRGHGHNPTSARIHRAQEL